MKTYNVMYNVGTVKYLVNYHDGIKTNKDGSIFHDIRAFKNKKKRDAFIKSLRMEGYKSEQFN